MPSSTEGASSGSIVQWNVLFGTAMRVFTETAARRLALFGIRAIAQAGYSQIAGPMGRNGTDLRQPGMGVAKRHELGAARSSRCEESLGW
jgi:hypothetical protein